MEKVSHGFSGREASTLAQASDYRICTHHAHTILSISLVYEPKETISAILPSSLFFPHSSHLLSL